MKTSQPRKLFRRIFALILLSSFSLQVSGFSQSDVLEYQLPSTPTLSGSDSIRVIFQANSAPLNSSQLITLQNFGLTVVPWLSGSASALLSGSSLLSGSAAQAGLAYSGTGGSFGTAAFQSARAFDPAGSASAIDTGSNTMSGFFNLTGTLSGTATIAGTNESLVFGPGLKATALSAPGQTVAPHVTALLQSQLTLSASNYNGNITFPADALQAESDIYTYSATDAPAGSIIGSEFAMFSYGNYALHAGMIGAWAVATQRTAQVDTGSNITGFQSHIGNQSTQTSGTTALYSTIDFLADSPICTGSQTVEHAIGVQINPQKINNNNYGYGIYQTGTNDLNQFNGQTQFWGSAQAYAGLNVTGTLSLTASTSIMSGTATIATRPNVSGTMALLSDLVGSPAALLPLLNSISYVPLTGYQPTAITGTGGATYNSSWYVQPGVSGSGAATSWYIQLPLSCISNAASGSQPSPRGLAWTRSIYFNVNYSPWASLPSSASASVARAFIGAVTSPAYTPATYSAGIEIRYPGGNAANIYAFVNTAGAMVYSPLLFQLTNNCNYSNYYHFSLCFSSGTYSVIFNGTTYPTGLTPPSSDSGNTDNCVVQAVSNDAIMTGGQALVPQNIIVY